MIEQGAQALYNGEAETQADLIGFRGVGEPVEFAENLAPLVFRDAGPAVSYLNAQLCAPVTATDDDAAHVCIADRVRNKIEDVAPQQQRNAAHPRAARHQPQR